MKKTMTILSSLCIIGLAACGGETPKTDDGHGQDTAKQDTLAHTQKGNNQVDEMKGLISCDDAHTFVTDLHTRIDNGGGRITINANDPIVWKIAPSDLANLTNGSDSAIALLGEENGQLTLIIGRGVNGQGAFQGGHIYETFKPLTTVMSVTSPQARAQFDAELYKNCTPTP